MLLSSLSAAKSVGNSERGTVSDEPLVILPPVGISFKLYKTKNRYVKISDYRVTHGLERYRRDYEWFHLNYLVR